MEEPYLKIANDFLDRGADISNLSIEDLIRLSNVADVLNIPTLLDMCCSKIADELNGKTKYEMRRLLNLKNNFSTNEERKIEMEHEWVYHFYKNSKQKLT